MAGVVVNIGEARIKRQLEHAVWQRKGQCRHLNLTLDDNGHIVRCDDCKESLSAYWVIGMITEFHRDALRNIAARERAVAADKDANLHLIAARKVEKVWRSRSMVPCCPHCGHGILPEDNLGDRQMGKRFEIARRKKEDRNP